MLVLVWCSYLAVQWGDPYDETEHAHAAWLIGHLGHRPHTDFFQHHQPTLWHLLALYYVFGGTGPEVLYWGRALVVASALITFLGLWSLARKTARGDGSEVSRAPSGLLALAPWIAMSIAFPPLFVARPETLGLACYVLSVCCWLLPSSHTGRTGIGRDILAGALFGLAVLFSPRYLPLAAGFLLLPKDRARLFHLRWDLIPAALACVAVVLGYLRIADYSLVETRFNVEFTAVMTKIGRGYFNRADRIAVAVGVGMTLCWLLARNLRGTARQRFLIQSLFLAGLVVLCVATAWPYLYSQSMVMALAWASVVFAQADGEIRRSENRLSTTLGYALAGCWTVIAAIYLLGDLSAHQTVMARVEQKRGVLELLDADELVLMGSASHPICARDASFYCHPIVDVDERLPRTVARLRDRWGLPVCDFHADIFREKPAIIDHVILEVLPERELREVIDLIHKEYVAVAPYSAYRDNVYRPLYRRVTAGTSPSAQLTLNPAAPER